MEILCDIQIPRFEIGGNLMITLAVAIVVVFRLIVAILRHKEIMAAIEKGVPLTQLRHPIKMPNWITSTSIGTAALIVSVGIFCFFLKNQCDTGALLVASIFCGIGVLFLIRGLLLRKVRQNNSTAQQSDWGAD